MSSAIPKTPIVLRNTSIVCLAVGFRSGVGISAHCTGSMVNQPQTIMYLRQRQHFRLLLHCANVVLVCGDQSGAASRAFIRQPPTCWGRGLDFWRRSRAPARDPRFVSESLHQPSEQFVSGLEKVRCEGRI